MTDEVLKFALHHMTKDALLDFTMAYIERASEDLSICEASLESETERANKNFANALQATGALSDMFFRLAACPMFATDVLPSPVVAFLDEMTDGSKNVQATYSKIQNHVKLVPSRDIFCMVEAYLVWYHLENAPSAVRRWIEEQDVTTTIHEEVLYVYLRDVSVVFKDTPELKIVRDNEWHFVEEAHVVGCQAGTGWYKPLFHDYIPF